MPPDLSKLSDADLEAIANNDMSKVSDAGLAHLSQPEISPAQGPQPDGAAPQFYPTGAGVAMPNVGGAVGGAYNTAKTIAGPALGGVANTLGTYVKNPIAGLTDLTAGHFGLPPPVAASQITPGIRESYQQVKDWLTKTGQFTPKQPIQPITVPASSPVGQVVAGGPAAQEGAGFMESILSKFAPMARAVGPVLNTVGRVAGPAGMAYNAYEAAKYAQDAELGQRLASGQGQLAQHNFRQMNPVYGAPISREQAQAVLQSGSPRDIAAFGGADRLRSIAGIAAPAPVQVPQTNPQGMI